MRAIISGMILLSVLGCNTKSESNNDLILAALLALNRGTTAAAGSTAASETYDWGTFTDQLNGTVRFVGKAGTFGGNTYTAQTIFFMMCSQGQSWDSSGNTCNSTDNAYAGNTFCNANDSSCDNGTILNGTGTSTVYTACDSLSFAGKTNWRVPTKKELKTIIHCTDRTMPADSASCAASTSPTVNTLFPKTIDSIFWSASASNTTSAWTVNFLTGIAQTASKSDPNYLRCVAD